MNLAIAPISPSLRPAVVVANAGLMARSRADISLYDNLIEGYRTAGLLPA
jgi:hypothetical protein